LIEKFLEFWAPLLKPELVLALGVLLLSGLMVFQTFWWIISSFFWAIVIKERKRNPFLKGFEKPIQPFSKRFVRELKLGWAEFWK